MDNRNSLSLKILGLGFVFLLVGTVGVMALGVSTPYWRDHALEVYPGQERDVSFTLLNKIGNPTAKAYVTLEDGDGIAEIVSGNEYSVASGARDVKIILRIKVPESARIGDGYDVKFNVKATPDEDEGGNVQLGVGYGVDFPVSVVAESDVPKSVVPVELPQKIKQNNSGLIILIVIIILLIFVVIWMLKKKK